MTDHYRKAALCLHNLAPADREWILRQLPPFQRSELEVLLGDLKTMKVPAGLLPLAAPDSRGSDKVNDELPQPDPFHVLDQCKAPVVWSTLSAEQDEVIAIILAFRAWTWHAAVLKQFAGPRRNEIARLKDVVKQRVSFTVQCRIISVFARKLGLPIQFDIEYPSSGGPARSEDSP